MDAWIYDTVRTPRGAGRDKGSLAGVKPLALTAGLYRALQQRLDFDPALVADVVLGCVTQFGDQGTNPARISVLYAGWPDTVAGITVNRFCTSALDACHLAALKVSAGGEQFAIGGGVESMSRVPMFSDEGAWLKDKEVMRRTAFTPLGISADLVASLDGITRDAADAYALRSQQRAAAARESGRFERSLVPVTDADGNVVLDRDETIRADSSAEKLAGLPPAFAELGAKGVDKAVLARYPGLERIDHVHTVGNSPAMADGAALALIGTRAAGEAAGLAPRARVVAAATAAADPVIMLTAGETAARRALEQAGIAADALDVIECNEAFAAPTLRFQREFGLDDERFNVNGGAIAFGHPMGATGAMLLASVIDELERRDGRYGLVAVAGGGGLGTAMVVERA